MMTPMRAETAETTWGAVVYRVERDVARAVLFDGPLAGDLFPVDAGAIDHPLAVGERVRVAPVHGDSAGGGNAPLVVQGLRALPGEPDVPEMEDNALAVVAEVRDDGGALLVLARPLPGATMLVRRPGLAVGDVVGVSAGVPGGVSALVHGVTISVDETEEERTAP